MNLWKYCLNQVIGIIFVVDISCYNEFYYDSKTYTKTRNKMTETIEKFKQMIYEDMGDNIAFYVFFNKIDTFKQKIIKGISIKTCPEFKDYKGDEYDYNECISYIKSIFDGLNEGNVDDDVVFDRKSLYLSETCAIHKGDVNRLNLLGTINDNVNSEEIKNVWHKFGENLNYHWNELNQS